VPQEEEKEQVVAKHKRVLSPQEIKEARKAGIHDSVIDAAVELANLTPKQKALAKEVLTNPGATALEQVKNAGYSVTEKSKPQHLKKQLEGRLSATLREFGIFEDDLAKVVADGLQAVHVKILRIPVRGDKGFITGERIEYHETPDYPTRLATFKILCSLGDYFPAKKIKVDGKMNVTAFHGIDPALLEMRRNELMKKKREVDAEFTVEPETTNA
jgi:hypothetical protein